MRIRDWSSDVCSSDLLLSADHTASWLQPAQHLNRTAFLPGVTWSDGLRSLWAGQQTMPYEPRQWPPISATLRRARASTSICIELLSSTVSLHWDLYTFPVGGQTAGIYATNTHDPNKIRKAHR